jgi:hypothetical protein
MAFKARCFTEKSDSKAFAPPLNPLSAKRFEGGQVAAKD